MYENIPQELKAYRSWVVWKYYEIDGTYTKVPFDPKTGYKASSTDPQTWADYDIALAVATNGHFDGLGFVFSDEDPFFVIDFDATYADGTPISADDLARQGKIYDAFNTYSELSPSGKGLHIIGKGKFDGPGCKRNLVEVYCRARFMTMTGNVYRNAPVNDCSYMLESLYSEMARPQMLQYDGSAPQTEDDQTIYNQAANAENGAKFLALWEGRWHEVAQDWRDKSQSAADQALINMLAFYTQNFVQIKRMFLASALGQRDKAKRTDYVDRTIKRSFDRMTPPIDIDGFNAQWEAVKNAASSNGKTTAFEAANAGSSPAAATMLPSGNTFQYEKPPGLVGALADMIYGYAPRPVPEIALVGALGLMGGIVGRGWQVSNTGINIYLLLLANTGSGKEAINLGINKILSAVTKYSPMASEFIGPDKIASGPALIKYLREHPSWVSIQGEFAHNMKKFISPNANAALTDLKAEYLRLYMASTHGTLYRGTIYSDQDKNKGAVMNPALTIVGECAPEFFESMLSEDLINDGLLPRCSIIEYRGPRVDLNPWHHTFKPDEGHLKQLGDLITASHAMMAGNQSITVALTPGAQNLMDAFDRETSDLINSAPGEAVRNLWNRAHLKAMRMAALVAVGCNTYQPVIDEAIANWAINIVRYEVDSLVRKFVKGEVGSIERKQENDVIRACGQLINRPYEHAAAYGVSRKMWSDKSIPYVYLQRKLLTLASFRGDRNGARMALKRVIQDMVEAGTLQEIPPLQVSERYKKRGRVFILADIEQVAEIV